MKIKEYENKESTYWGVSFDLKPDQKGWVGDIEVQAIKGFGYVDVHGVLQREPFRIWTPATIRWHARSAATASEATDFAEQLRNAWIKALQMDFEHGLIKSGRRKEEYCKCGVKLPCDRYACNSEEQI